MTSKSLIKFKCYILIVFLLCFVACWYYSNAGYFTESTSNVSLITESTSNVSLISCITVQRIQKQNGSVHISTNKEIVDEDMYIEQIRKICYQDDWKHILEPCKDNMKWENRSSSQNSIKSTKAIQSIVDICLRPIGYPSIIKISTKDLHGKWKTFGGDFWNVKLTGRLDTMINVKMSDNNDGTYTGYFLLLHPGTYNVTCVLESTLCNGLRDPPLDWFVKGTVQGKFQREGTLSGDCDDFIHEKISPIQIKLQITNATTLPKHLHSPPKPFNRYCGFWKDNTFQSYSIQPGEKYGSSDIKIKKRLENLMVYGDSMGRRLYESVKNRTLCTRLFHTCALSYTWVYKFHDEKQDKYEGVHIYDMKDFNETKYFIDILEDIVTKEMLKKESAYIINFGIHPIMTLQMDRLMNVFKSFVSMIEYLKRIYGIGNFPMIIWKTTTPPFLENFLPRPSTQLRFLTKHRVVLWNAFTKSYALEHSIPVMDIYDMANSYPQGPLDLVHFEYDVFKTAEDDLMMFLIQEMN